MRWLIFTLILSSPGFAMAWSDKFVTLTSGNRVRYSFIQRDDSDHYYVRFIDVDGRKVKLIRS